MPINLDNIASNSMYSVAESAKLLKLSEQTVRAYLANRILIGIKGKTGRWKVSGAELLRYAKG